VTTFNVTNRALPVERIYFTAPHHLSAASTDAVYTNDIIKSPVTSVKSTLTGRLTGLLTSQLSGQPGADGASLSLRGQDPLVIIDGVVANLTVFNLEDVESVTVLKDALGTAMLGVRGSNGAILITTRKGKPFRQQISFTAQTSIQKSIGAPKTLRAYDFARLYNEALTNDGFAPVYTATDLEAYRTGSDPIGHPDVNWREQILRSSSRFDRYTLSATGGNNFARYYVSLEHVNQTGFFRTLDSNKFNTNNDFKSYVIRSNVDVSVNKSLTGGIYLLGRILNGTEPGIGTGNLLINMLFTPSNSSPVLNPNGSFGGSQQYQYNLYGLTVASGYLSNYKRDMLVNFYLKQLLDGITLGLWFKIKGGYAATLSENINRAKNTAVYQFNGTTYTQYGSNTTQANSNGIQYQGRLDYEEISLGYDRVFQKKHGINALVLVNRDNSTSGSDLPYTITGMSGRFSYNYKEKYVVEAAFGYNGSNRYPENGAIKRGFFPAVGIGWNMEKEKFMQHTKWVTRLKLFGSFGKTGWDDPGYFTYFQRFFDANSVYFGTSAGTQTAITEQPITNPNMKWEQAQKFNIGVDATFLDNRLGFSMEYYNNKFYDLLMIRGRNITMIGNDYPRENIGKTRYYGFESRLTWQETIRNFQYFISLNATIRQSEVLYIDEVFRAYDWMKRTGQPVNSGFGYISDGLFQSQVEVNNSPTTVGYTPQLGDIKYRDLNNDGVIDQFDVAPIGNGKPLAFFGLTVGAQWKGFDFSALLQGVKRQMYVGGINIWAFQNNGLGQAYEHNLGRWTPANGELATYPRLSVGENPNNQAVSSYWMRDGSFMRLKNIELGYSLPESILKRIRLDNIRVFIRGFNLVTFSDSKEIYDRDPEVSTGFFYPLQKLYNFGITIKL
jgi:TonB-linked SusC/RagA family outer membrane protein